MGVNVTIADKKYFIRWFLQHYELKKRECVWLLNYLLNDDFLLEHVHFIRHAEYCPKAIIMSARCTADVPFQYFKKHIMTVEPEKAFHDIRLCANEEIYIQLNFKNNFANPEYVGVLEENPFYIEQINKSYADWAQAVLDRAEKQFQQKHLSRLIDLALDAHDEQWFYELTEKLNGHHNE